ncbi:MAG: hypothetical protein ACOYXU_09050 [Nitrospirota bacterium]
MRLDAGQIEVLDDAMAEVLRRKEPWERLAIGFALWRDARKMIEYHLRTIHPDWTGDQINREVARRMSHGAV